MKRVGWILTTGLVSAGALCGQVSPAGPEFQVNTATFAYQERPSVGMSDSGEFVVVWDDWYYVMPGASGSVIQARRFAADGVPIGIEFQVDDAPAAGSVRPAVALGPEGSFVVVWKGFVVSELGPLTRGIFARRFDGSGVPTTPPLVVVSSTESQLSSAAVASLPSGGFVVAWQQSYSAEPDTSEYSIQARRFDGVGVPLGAQFQVNSYSTGRQVYPVLASDGAGGFVVVWQSEGSAGNDGSSHSIQARRFDAAGLPLGTDLQVNSYTTGSQQAPHVAAAPQGGFVVVFGSEGSPGGDTSLFSVQARRFDSGGTPTGAQFQVNTFTSNSQWRPSVAIDGRGDFVIAWQNEVSIADWDVRGRRFRADGSPLSNEFQVNTYTSGRQGYPVVAAESAGNLLVAWESDGSYGSDDDRLSVQARRYDDLFRDGFESGGSGRWSAVWP